MKETYIEKNFNSKTLTIIDQANEIVVEYQSDGMNLTLRQLYYQFVSRDLFGNTTENYNKLGRILSDARLAGLIDWTAIEDRTRSLKGLSHWSNPGSIIESAAWGYRLDKWKNQDNYVEVWIEKEALVGVIETICNELDVNYFACKGYVSQSEMWRAARRLKEKQEDGKYCTIIHLGDHDPSGVDMTRDIKDRQALFHNIEYQNHPEVERIALNISQIEEHKPPPNPAKITDSRAKDYIKRYGNESWELDALNPTILRSLIESTVLKYRNKKSYIETIEIEKQHKAILEKISSNWETL